MNDTPLSFDYNPIADVLTVEGVPYSGALFRAWSAHGMPVGTLFMLIGRDNGKPFTVGTPTVIRDRRPTWDESEAVERAGGCFVALLENTDAPLVMVVRRSPEGAPELHTDVLEWFWVADGAPMPGVVFRPIGPDGEPLRLEGKT